MAKKTKTPGSSNPQNTVDPVVNNEMDPKKAEELQKAAAKAAAEAAAADKAAAAEEEIAGEKVAPKLNTAAKSEKMAKQSEKQAKKKTKTAEKKQPAKAKNAKNGKGDKKKPNRFVNWWKELLGEMKKIQWTNGKDTVKNTLVVLLVILIIGIGVWLVDWGLVEARQAINGAAVKDPETARMVFQAALGAIGIVL